MNKATENKVTQSEFEAKKKSAIKLLECFEGRLGWGVFSKSVAVSSQIPRAKSYELLLGKIVPLENTLAGNIALDAILSLKGALLEHCLSGEKSLKLFNLCHGVKDKILKLIDTVKDDKLNLNDAVFLHQDELTEKPYLTATHHEADGVSIVFSSIRRVKVKEELPHSALADEFKDELPSSAQLYCVKYIDKVCMDVVFIPSERDVVELRVDNSENFNSDLRHNAHIALMVAFKSLCKGRVGDILRGEYVELFPAIKKLLYLPVGDGRVVELKFTTSEGAVKHHKSRRRSDGCIWRDNYHLAGAKEINEEFDPYMIARVWAFNHNGAGTEPELMLPGNMRMLSYTSKKGVLQEAIITKTASRNDYKMVLNKLLDMISS